MFFRFKSAHGIRHKLSQTEERGTDCTDFRIDPTKSEFKTVRVWARSREVSPDIHYSICSDSL